MNFATNYLGLHLHSPIVPSASPLTENLDNVKRMEDAGAAAIVFHSLFEEQLHHGKHEFFSGLDQRTERFAEPLPNIPPESFRVNPNQYLEHLLRAKASVRVPIIASLNGHSEGGWIEFAKQIRQTGVDGLELNIYSVPTDPNESSIEIETRYLRIVSAVKAAVQIPVAVKLSPYFTSFANVARKFVQQGGADALVLFNRFYQPDVDPERLEVVPDVVLSTPTAHRLPLRWIAILRGQIQADLAATGGIHSAADIVKLLMAGANVTMVCSALLRYGIAHLTTLEQQLAIWMESHEYESVNQLQGCMSQLNCSDPDAFERAQYIHAVARLPKRGSADAPEQPPRAP
ncbi:MAG TPA: dihydroorotate dehydrogenase-like protein [Chthoniobacterales bacterium]